MFEVEEFGVERQLLHLKQTILARDARIKSQERKIKHLTELTRKLGRRA